MAIITAEEIAAAYATAKDVFAGTIPEAAAVKALAQTTGMSASSASDYIRNLRQMLKGEAYHRTLSIPAADFYLRNIRADFGEAPYANALQSLERHLAYYERLPKGHRQPGLQSLLDRHRVELGGPDLGAIEAALAVQIKAALALSPAEREHRLGQAPKKPRRSTATVTFSRAAHS